MTRKFFAAIPERIRGARAALVSLLIVGGCQSPVTQFEVVSFRSTAPEVYREQFDAGYYCVNADHNWMFVFEIEPVQVPVTPEVVGESAATQPSDASAPDQELWMSQVLQVEVFWKAQPGTSFAERSQTNANIVYCLTTGAGSITYEGAGFVWFAPSMDKKSMRGNIESATLYPARTVKEPPDLFGPCRLTGEFTAVEDRKRVVEKMREVRRRVGPPVTSN
ncbi:MAG TPA: hypothetical protein VJZ71_00945 [Phycisphaerae bacterium]|nr:hypothetical protein [Phycisphaerae bacterium]